MVMKAFVFAQIALIGRATAQDEVNALFSGSQSGTQTWYSYPGRSGTCQINVNVPFQSSITADVAISAAQLASGDDPLAACGACVQGTYSDGTSFVGLVEDTCDDCADGDLAFGVFEPPAGSSDVTWRAVECPVGNSSVQYEFKDSSSTYVKLGVRAHRCPVATLEIEQAGEYRQAVRTEDNFFECSSENGCMPGEEFTVPFLVRVTSVFGETINGALITIEEENERPTTGGRGTDDQFTACGGGSGSSSGVAAGYALPNMLVYVTAFFAITFQRC